MNVYMYLWLKFYPSFPFFQPESEVGKSGKAMEAFLEEQIEKYLPFFNRHPLSPASSGTSECSSEWVPSKRRKRDQSRDGNSKTSKERKEEKQTIADEAAVEATAASNVDEPNSQFSEDAESAMDRSMESDPDYDPAGQTPSEMDSVPDDPVHIH